MLKRMAIAVMLPTVLMLALAGSALARGPAGEACSHADSTPAAPVLTSLGCQTHP